MRYQPGYGYIPEDEQELAGLRKFVKRFIKKYDPITAAIVAHDPITSKILGEDKPAAEPEPAAAPIPEMPAMPQTTAAPVAPLVSVGPATSSGGGYGTPMMDPLEETESPPQPLKAGLFSGDLTIPLMIGAGILGLLLFGRPQLPPPAPRRYKLARRRRR